MPETADWTAKPHSYAAADVLRSQLGLSHATAAILVRRGYDSVEAARSFLAAEDRNDATALPDVDRACRLILQHVGSGSRIVVHGDYDVDGVSSTAVVVRALRRLGASPDWHLPSRFEDGYGLSRATVERLAGAGAGLLITVDCGVTACEEVALARTLGLDVVVTDHHRPGDALPECPVVHPALGDHPYPHLCATAVAHKLAQVLYAMAGADSAALDDDLDLVALATVCDVVPLVGENRRLVRDGLRVLGRASKPGLRALMRSSGADPGSVDAHALGFRLGPRLNAAGRLGRADAALELLLTEDDERAESIASELEGLNRDRQETEQRILWEAQTAAVEQLDRAALVLAGDGWHPGVIGIVASRLVQEFRRPCVMVALDGDSGRGSGRSIGRYDLHAGLAACSGHLMRFGGHRMAAGLELERAALPAFRRALSDHAGALLSPPDLRRVERVDAVVPGGSLGLALAEELERLGPFGEGNPEPTLLVPAARISDVRGMGEEQKHSRFTISSGGRRARAVAFRTPPGPLAKLGEESCSLCVRLERSEWNGVVEPRLVLRATSLPARTPCEAWPEPSLREALALQPAPAPPAAPARIASDRREEGIAGIAGELLATGERVLVVCADPVRRRAALDRVLGGLVPGVRPTICSWDALADDVRAAAAFPHLLLLDPAPSGALQALATAAPCEEQGFVHLAWGAAETQFARRVYEEALDLRPALTAAYRALREQGGAVEGQRLEQIMRPARRGARLIRVLEELGLATYDELTGACTLRTAQRTELERSAVFRECEAALEEMRVHLGAGERPLAAAA